jgi:hypothetical protein
LERVDAAIAARPSAIDDDRHLPLPLPAVCPKKVSVSFDGGTLSPDQGVHRDALR